MDILILGDQMVKLSERKMKQEISLNLKTYHHQQLHSIHNMKVKQCIHFM